MDEDTAIINENTRKEKIKAFFVKNTKKITIVISTLFLILFGYFVLLPPALHFLITFGEGIAEPMIRIGNYISLLVNLLFWMI